LASTGTAGLGAFGGIAILVPDFLALSWLGMWMGLKSSRFSRHRYPSRGNALLLVLLLVLFSAAAAAFMWFMNAFFFCGFVAAGI
jgi:hypothetical protein